jgi:hypothetical protein
MSSTRIGRLFSSTPFRIPRIIPKSRPEVGMSRARIYDEPMIDKVHVRLDAKDAEAVDAISTREGRRSGDVVRQFVSLGLRIYPSFGSFAEIINTDLVGIARRILGSQKSQKTPKRQKTKKASKAPRKKARPTRGRMVK